MSKRKEKTSKRTGTDKKLQTSVWQEMLITWSANWILGDNTLIDGKLLGLITASTANNRWWGFNSIEGLRIVKIVTQSALIDKIYHRSGRMAGMGKRRLCTIHTQTIFLPSNWMSLRSMIADHRIFRLLSGVRVKIQLKRYPHMI